MNNNKQLNKGDKMRKIAMLIGIVSILGLSSGANAYYEPKIYTGGWKICDGRGNCH